VVLVISGLLAGAPFIVLGEMMRVFLDLRRLARRRQRVLRRIARNAEHVATPSPSVSAAADRLIPRRP
jgi:hypothetical protein